jgi:Etoposide-induced protein 2.4 (EI24)
VIRALGLACLSFWQPKVLLWALLPQVLAAALVAGSGWFFWEPALDAISQGIDSFELSPQVLRWLDAVGARQLRSLVGPIVVVALAVPVVMLLSLLLVTLLALPGLVRHVANRRFAALQPLRGASTQRVLLRGLVCCLIALMALMLSLPLWLVPPLVLLLPLLIWGWLASRLFSYAVLAPFASMPERRVLLHQHRWSLWAMGLACGALASLPSLVWTAGPPALIAAPLLGPVAVWLYTSVFVFAALWFAHFLLAQLQAQRGSAVVTPPPPAQAAALHTKP